MNLNGIFQSCQHRLCFYYRNWIGSIHPQLSYVNMRISALLGVYMLTLTIHSRVLYLLHWVQQTVVAKKTLHAQRRGMQMKDKHKARNLNWRPASTLALRKRCKHTEKSTMRPAATTNTNRKNSKQWTHVCRRGGGAPRKWSACETCANKVEGAVLKRQRRQQATTTVAAFVVTKIRGRTTTATAI